MNAHFIYAYAGHPLEGPLVPLEGDLFDTRAKEPSPMLASIVNSSISNKACPGGEWARDGRPSEGSHGSVCPPAAAARSKHATRPERTLPFMVEGQQFWRIAVNQTSCLMQGRQRKQGAVLLERSRVWGLLLRVGPQPRRPPQHNGCSIHPGSCAAGLRWCSWDMYNEVVQ